MNFNSTLRQKLKFSKALDQFKLIFFAVKNALSVLSAIKRKSSLDIELDLDTLTTSLIILVNSFLVMIWQNVRLGSSSIRMIILVM